MIKTVMPITISHKYIIDKFYNNNDTWKCNIDINNKNNVIIELINNNINNHNDNYNDSNIDYKNTCNDETTCDLAPPQWLLHRLKELTFFLENIIIYSFINIPFLSWVVQCESNLYVIKLNNIKSCMTEIYYELKIIDLSSVSYPDLTYDIIIKV